MKNLFEMALNIEAPWFIKDIDFKVEQKRLTICIDFKEGSKFYYKDEGENIEGNFKAYDTEEKEWRHLNFFQHECFLKARIPRVDVGNNKIRLITGFGVEVATVLSATTLSLVSFFQTLIFRKRPKRKKKSLE